jgi:hypothetical protein
VAGAPATTSRAPVTSVCAGLFRSICTLFGEMPVTYVHIYLFDDACVVVFHVMLCADAMLI